MAFREVTMLEVKEVVRRWLASEFKKAIARQTGLSRNTVRCYIKAALKCGLRKGSTLTDESLAAVLVELKAPVERVCGESWADCERHRDFIEKKLVENVTLTKVGRLLGRQGVAVPYATLHRFAVKELGFGHQAPSIPVSDCEPGAEVQLDTGWMVLLEPDVFGKRRRFRAWIFTSVYSRHRFVYPCFEETTKSAIEACEAAWAFFGGVFAVVIPDNTKTIVNRADPLRPLINEAFLEYAQARGFAHRPGPQWPPRRTRPASNAPCPTCAKTVSGASASSPLRTVPAAPRCGAATSTACAGTPARSDCRARPSRRTRNRNSTPRPASPTTSRSTASRRWRPTSTRAWRRRSTRWPSSTGTSG